MKKIIVVFRSKTEVFEYVDALNENGISSAIVGTPKEARIGCGIAVELDYRYIASGFILSAARRFKGFYGIFAATRKGDRVSVSRFI